MLKQFFSPSIPQEVSLDGTSFRIKHSLRKNMKRIIMRVENRNELRLSSSRVSKYNLLNFIYENKSWILDQHLNIKDEFCENSLFYYLNRPYRIKHHNKPLRIDKETVFLNPLKTKLQSDMFYKKAAKSYLPKRVDFWKEKMNLECNSLGFRLAKKRWGSCNSKRDISLNPYMMKLSLEMIDYIIVHELSHLVHLNHSKAFYKHIEDFMPNYRYLEQEIKRVSQF